MIKTNEWTVADLVKYLVAVRSTLTSEEWARLQLTRAFSKEHSSDGKLESDQKQGKFQAKELYEPQEVFRELGLPIIDWGADRRWRSNSEEGWI
jgi:hypothetical protein